MTSTQFPDIISKSVVKNRQPDFKRTLVSKQVFWNLFRTQYPEFQITEENQHVIFSIFRYFLQQQDFNEFGIIKNKPGLDKGLLVYGGYGVGKSTLFDALHHIGRIILEQTRSTQLWFPQISTVHLLTRYYESQQNKNSNFKLEDYYRGKLYLDDVGKENKAYNREEIIGKLLYERHRRRLKTFVTTNENPSAISARYGHHIGDRLPEMFNIIKWEGRSWRE
ncbi:ATP-binding protein [Salegentibacter sp. Hel_I_6]|uniref:ATP-binding protein n=1 Tax=Salegentibacter sp. Hel_I_6 TaxID=1250278 RepID=UPI000690B976|nr:ATP-binding protein [Salegentibacter sp. Hel_I_6]